ncbi:hypothetical protein D3C71_25910 [compost metagenome]
MLSSTISLPAGLSAAALAQRLYPQGWQQGDALDLRRGYFTLLREVARLNLPASNGVGEQQLELQRQALQLALASAHQRASDAYFSRPGWTQHYLDKSGSVPAIWYFMVANLGMTAESRHFRINSDTGAPRLTTGGDLHALQVASDEDHVRMSLKLGFTSFGENPQYAGPARGLVDWARSKGVLLQRVQVHSIRH